MNRIIKFRAWDGTKMQYQFPMASDNWLPSSFSDVWEVMQFTGLHDKNGKEIYEGDVLDVIQYEGKGAEMRRARNTVGWNDDMARFDFTWSTDGLVGIGGSRLDLFLVHFRSRGSNTMDWYLDFEVIGNIFEHPELLNPKEAIKKIVGEEKEA